MRARLEAQAVGQTQLVVGKRLALISVEQAQARQRLARAGADCSGDLCLRDGVLYDHRQVTLDGRQLRSLVDAYLLRCTLLERRYVEHGKRDVLRADVVGEQIARIQLTHVPDLDGRLTGKNDRSRAARMLYRRRHVRRRIFNATSVQSVDE